MLVQTDTRRGEFLRIAGWQSEVLYEAAIGAWMVFSYKVGDLKILHNGMVERRTVILVPQPFCYAAGQCVQASK